MANYMYAEFISKHKDDFDKTVEHFKKELASLRTGRANPSLVEDLLVEAYGVKTPVKQMSSISVPDPKSLLIDPWDKNLLKDIEKAIVESDIGISPVLDGKVVRLNMPQMTEENRQEYLKILSKKLEESKISIRRLRDEIKNQISEGLKSNELTEDDKYKLQADLDNFVADYNKQLEELGKKKENEIKSI